MPRKIGLMFAVVIAAVVFVVFFPGLKIGHEGSWWYLEWAAKLPVPDYLWQYFDPAHVTQGYRPMQGIMVLGEYSLFDVNSDGYHLAQIGMHLVTCWLLLAIVWDLSRNARLAFLSAAVFATLPAYHLAIFRAPGVVDPWAGMFYFGTVWLWIKYLRSRQSALYVITLIAFVLSLLSKEISVFLPLVLFVVDRWFVKLKTTPDLVLRQYVPFFIAMIPYLVLELSVQSHGEFSRDFGYQISPQMLFNLVPYLAVLTFPWYIDNFNVPAGILYYVWLALVTLMLVTTALVRKSRVIIFLMFFAILNISPLLGFPQEWFQARYLYIPLIATAVLIALAVDRAAAWLSEHRVLLAQGFVAFAVASLAIVGGQGISVKAAEWTEYMRQVRVPFHDISLQHPRFPEDTYLYFVYPTTTSLFDLDGLFFVRYGKGISIDGTGTGHPADLRRHSTSYVYYFDETNRAIELPVDQRITTHAAPAVPATFQPPITLEGYEVPSGAIERGKALVVILYWSAATQIDKDYMVFAHLVDANGKAIAGYDGPPQGGKMSMSEWRRGQTIVDAIVLPVTVDTPVSDNYSLELGVYDSTTMQRLPVIDRNGQPSDDKIVVQGFSVTP